jgi:tRNA threonylcarbamoyladenosine biosynthesis protein TsaB
MTLYINTANNKIIRLGIKKDNEIISSAEVMAEYAQGEKLLPAIDDLLTTNDMAVSDIKKIIVENRGESFTSLRIGVVTANTLGYALNIPVFSPKEALMRVKRGIDHEKIFIVGPKYNREPNITKKADK